MLDSSCLKTTDLDCPQNPDDVCGRNTDTSESTGKIIKRQQHMHMPCLLLNDTELTSQLVHQGFSRWHRHRCLPSSSPKVAPPVSPGRSSALKLPARENSRLLLQTTNTMGCGTLTFNLSSISYRSNLSHFYMEDHRVIARLAASKRNYLFL